MNHHTLTIQANHRPETLERLLRITRHRGFKIESLNMEQDQQNGQLCIEVSVCSERPLKSLEGQIAKLWDVIRVEESNSPSIRQSAYA
ncbi:acetolactate synthase 2 small subunit [Dongshaea marina]|uniref:acetolactate synthase 2 small subunit n=1 Tax=Dongshaea marina TaxID=2047966 RepID=UPI000D3E9493|nr:acetolactate synthase 2 small subunit [Dongshaea marina]